MFKSFVSSYKLKSLSLILAVALIFTVINVAAAPSKPNDSTKSGASNSGHSQNQNQQNQGSQSAGGSSIVTTPTNPIILASSHTTSTTSSKNNSGTSQKSGSTGSGNNSSNPTPTPTSGSSTKTPKPTAPTISITAPKKNATVSGTQTVTASVSDKQGIASVQYKLDGQNLGSPVTAAPYSFSWDTTATTNAKHSITAVATNTANLSTTSAAVSVTVKNTVTITDPNPPITTPTTPPTNTSLTADARVSFTFDDGLASAYTQAEPTLAKYGLTGTDYVITDCVDMVTAPNTCRANTDATYMTWSQVEALQNDGWEIGSHTLDHDCLASNSKADPDDCQKSTLTQAQVDNELAGSQAALAAHGINATDFSAPYGDYDNMVLAETAKYYASFRGFKDDNNNDWPYDDYLLNDLPAQETVDTVASIEAKIDDAIANHTWLVLTFHDIQPSPSQDPDDYQYGTAELDQIAAYVKAKQDAGLLATGTNVNEGLVTSSTNLLQNASFNDGIADGWTTDAPTNITADSGDNGSYPDPTNSVKLTSPTTGSAHLFSPKVNVTPGTTYLLKSFLNVQSLTTGEIAYYVDEYDANGNWISGQYLKQENSSFVEDMNFPYTPSSANVASASLQVIVSGTGITAYLDNVQWFPTGDPATTPPPVTTPPAPTNLMTNEAFDDGISDGWTTDNPSGITADNGNHGGPNNPVNSVKAVASASGSNTHLFSPKISVDSTKSYKLSTFLNLTSISSGEVGFYVDEYDANGNWISGQYKTGVSTVSSGDVSFTYTPSSANVKSASLQVIIVGNSGITAYIDDVRWYQN